MLDRSSEVAKAFAMRGLARSQPDEAPADDIPSVTSFDAFGDLPDDTDLEQALGRASY